MVAPQSRTLVRYRTMIARQPPTPPGCALAAHEQGDGGVFAKPSRDEQGTEVCSRCPFALPSAPA